MYPFNTDYSNIFDTSQPISNRPFIDKDDSFNLEDLDSCFFHLSSPYIHYEDESLYLQDLHNLLLQHQHLTSDATVPQPTIDMADSDNTDVGKPKVDNNGKFHSVIQEIPRRRSSKRSDRHSKIDTANGPRDRRIRLSFDVARKFFVLQDMLGCDKASKTVEWLLTKSNAAIKELARGFPHMKHSCSVGANSTASSTSECEVISGFDESAIEGNQQASINTTKAKPSCNKEKKTRGFRKTGFHPLARESREKARERARERTIEKRRLGESKVCVETMNHDLNGLGFWSPLETGEESGYKHMNPSYKVLAEVEEQSSHEQQLLGAR